MKVFLKITDESGETVCEEEFDASQPRQWRPKSGGKRLISPMPRQSDSENSGTYEIFGWVWQPQVRVDRPNGFQAPPQVPWQTNPVNGQNWGGVPTIAPSMSKSPFPFQQGSGLASPSNLNPRG